MSETTVAPPDAEAVDTPVAPQDAAAVEPPVPEQESPPDPEPDVSMEPPAPTGTGWRVSVLLLDEAQFQQIAEGNARLDDEGNVLALDADFTIDDGTYRMVVRDGNGYVRPPTGGGTPSPLWIDVTNPFGHVPTAIDVLQHTAAEASYSHLRTDQLEGREYRVYERKGANIRLPDAHILQRDLYWQSVAGDIVRRLHVTRIIADQGKDLSLIAIADRSSEVTERGASIPRRRIRPGSRLSVATASSRKT